METGNGIRVVFKFSELTKNDTKKRFVNPILKRQLLKTKGSAGIDALYFRGGGKKGPLKVVVKFTKSFLNKVYADGVFDRVQYRVRDLSRRTSAAALWAGRSLICGSGASARPARTDLVQARRAPRAGNGSSAQYAGPTSARAMSSRPTIAIGLCYLIAAEARLRPTGGASFRFGLWSGSS